MNHMEQLLTGALICGALVAIYMVWRERRYKKIMMDSAAPLIPSHDHIGSDGLYAYQREGLDAHQLIDFEDDAPQQGEPNPYASGDPELERFKKECRVQMISDNGILKMRFAHLDTGECVFGSNNVAFAEMDPAEVNKMFSKLKAQANEPQ